MKIKTLLLAAVALLAIASCDNKKREILGVMLDPTEIYLAKEAGSSADIQVLASEKWSIKSNADWLEISQPSGNGDATVSVKAKDANVGKPRKATSPVEILSLGLSFSFSTPTSSASYSLPVETNLTLSPTAMLPLTTLKYAIMPLKELNTESKIRA